eukprot:m.211796 g.211796  ORF g.211796 m.211796 type:complete len:950 (-) comp18946_c0_seq1:330-3179(-)
MFFDGDHRKKREISLRGVGRQTDRDDLLRQAQEARQQRELLRKQNAAATVIEHAVRHFLGRLHIHHAAVQEFEKQLLTCSDDAVLQDTLFHFFQSSRDAAVLDAYLRQAFEQGRMTSTWFSPAALAQPMWRARLQRLARLSLQSASSKRQLPFCDKFLLLFCNMNSWPAQLQPTLLPKLLPNFLEWCVSVLTADGSLAETVSAIVHQWLAKAEGAVVALQLLSSAWCTEMANPTVRKALFTDTVLKTPVLTMLHSAGRLPSAISKLAAGWLLYHLLQVPVQDIKSSVDMKAYLWLLEYSVSQAPLHVVLLDDDGDDTEMGDGQHYPDAFDEFPKLLCHPNLVSSVLALPFSYDDPNSRRSNLYLCRYFSRAMLYLDSALRVSVLSQLSYNSLFLGRLWFCLKEHLPALLQDLRDMASTSNTSYAITDAVIFAQLFADCYGHVLIIQSDEEFSQGVPLSIAEVVDVISTFKDVAVYLYVSRLVLSNELITLRASLSKLLAKLFERNTSLRFCQLETFTSQEVPMEDALLQSIYPNDLDNDDDEEQKSAEAGPGSQLSKIIGLLRHLPIVVPFEKRALVFRHLVQIGDAMVPHMNKLIEVRRDHMFEDCYRQLFVQGRLLKDFRVSIINEFGELEAGLDGGGLMREVLLNCARTAFDPSNGLFKYTAQNTLYPDPSAYMKFADFATRFEFLGFLMGKCMMLSMLMDIQFARFFLTKILGQHPLLHELQSLDPELYRNLLMLRDEAMDVSSLDLVFTVADERFPDGNQVVPLVPGGQDLQVTQANKMTYIYHTANFRLNVQIHQACQAFKRGLFAVISPTWIRMFDAAELQMLFSGTSEDVDLDDLQRNVVYQPPYDENHENIQLFWSVVREFDQEDVKNLVRFITSSPRAPLLGFKYLNPQIGIACAGFEDRLPTAGTCFNLLKLPFYSDRETMRQRLLYAIRSGAGFDLS